MENGWFIKNMNVIFENGESDNFGGQVEDDKETVEFAADEHLIELHTVCNWDD